MLIREWALARDTTVYNIMGSFYANNVVGVKSSHYDYTQSHYYAIDIRIQESCTSVTLDLMHIRNVTFTSNPQCPKPVMSEKGYDL